MAISKTDTGAEAADSASDTTLASASFNSTGYTHLVVLTKWEGADATVTPSDNKGSSGWTSLTKINHSNNDLHAQLHWVEIGTPGTGHVVTMTASASRPFKTIAVWGVTSGGDIELVDEDGASGTGTAADGGTLSNAGAASVVSFMGVGEYAAVTHTASGWTEDFDGVSPNYTAGYSRGAETTTSIDPAATVSSSSDWLVVAAMFKESAGGGTDVLTADDVQSTSNVTTPAIGQKHVLLANDVQSTSNVTVATLGQVHVLLADDVQSTSNVTTPAVGQKHVLLANDVESASEVSAPALGEEGTNALLANDVQSTSQVSTPALGQVHVLTAEDIESDSSVSSPALDAPVAPPSTITRRSIPTAKYVPTKSPINADPVLRGYVEREFQAVARALPGEPFPITDAERDAGVMPVSFQYEPGDVRRYGATPDGLTNCSTAIQNAVNQSQQAKGAPVYFPAGDNPLGSAYYVLVTGISVTSPVLIYGDSPWRSTIVCTANITAFSFTNAASRSVVRDLAIYGIGGASTLPGVLFTNSQRNILQRVYVTRFDCGVRYATGASGSYLCTILDSQILFNISIDIDIEANGNALTVMGCQFGQGTLRAIVCTESNSLVVIGCDFESVVTRAIEILIAGGSTIEVGALISGCHFEANQSSSGEIWLRTINSGSRIAGVTIQSCLFVPTGTNYSPLVVVDADGVSFVGNTIASGYTSPHPDVSPTARNYVQYGNTPVDTVPNRYMGGRIVGEISTVTYSASMTIDAQLSNDFVITATNNTAFAINAPTSAFIGQTISITLRNNSGGALGAATWNAIFKMSAWTNPADTTSRSISFRYNGTNWVQVSQTGVDVPN